MSDYDTNNINFGQEYEEAGKLMPTGWYDCIVSNTEYTRSSTGKPMIKATLYVENGPRKGNVLYTQFVYSPDNQNAKRMFYNHMKYFGFDGDFWGRLPAGDAGFEQLKQEIKGKRIGVEVVHREWPPSSGIFRENVNGYQQSSASGPIPPNLVAGDATSSFTGGPPVPNGGSSSPPVPSAPATPSAPPVPPPPSMTAF